jgi:hypothetical protein
VTFGALGRREYQRVAYRMRELAQLARQWPILGLALAGFFHLLSVC